MGAPPEGGAKGWQGAKGKHEGKGVRKGWGKEGVRSGPKGSKVEGKGVRPGPKGSKVEGKGVGPLPGPRASEGEGKGVRPGPQASEDDREGTDTERKGVRPGAAEKPRALVEAEKRKRKWEAGALQLLPRSVPNPSGPPDVWRTPMAHRRGHVNPNKLFKMVRNFPSIWKAHMTKHEKDFKDAKLAVGAWLTPGEMRKAKDCVRRWLAERFLDDCECIENINGKGRDKLLERVLFDGLRVRDFTGNAAPEWPSVGDWDFYFTDVNPRMWAWVEGEALRDMWLQWHGTNVYGTASSLATSFLARSELDKKGHEMACGRGVYTTALFGKAVQYAYPIVFEEAKVLVRMVLLVCTPQHPPCPLTLASVYAPA